MYITPKMNKYFTLDKQLYIIMGHKKGTILKRRNCRG